MIKYLFILINSIAVFIFGLFSGDGGIAITSNIPSTLQVNQEFSVEIKVNKGKMGGFAKLQLDLPEGFSVKEIENQGATFSFNNGIAKWIWSSLPNEEEMTLKIGLTASETAHGIKTIGAKYSYVENNVKQQVDMTPIEVNVLNAGESAPAETSGNKTSSDSLMAKAEVPVPSTNAEPTGTIEIVRSFTTGTNPNETTVEITIKKGITSGFARYSDDLGNGFAAKAIKTDGGSFSVADQKIKFVWVNVPDKEELVISYQIQRLSSKSLIVLNGEYSYLEHNQSKKSKAESQTIPYEETQVALVPAEEIKTEPVPEAVVTAPIEKKAETQEVTSEKTEKIATETTLEKNQSQAKYAVQIGAFTNSKVGTKTLKNKFKINETIHSEMQNGFSKFIIGTHIEYKNARNHRDVMVNNNGVKSAFVVAYNNGKRITVQEALMISNQKWFK